MEKARTREGSPGGNGGGRSVVQRWTKITPDGREIVIGGLSPNSDWTNPLLAGTHFGYHEQFKFESTGGGWGPPKERPVEKVPEDVLDDYVLIEAAREVYGAVIDVASMSVDASAAKRLRIAH